MTHSAPTDDDVTPVLLYDGDCGLCARSVQFVLSHECPERRAALRFAPLQGAYGAKLRVRHPEIASIDSVAWYEPTGGHPSRVRVRSDAALATMTHLGGAWRAFSAIAIFVPRPIRDAVYDAIARRRFRLVAQSCLLPSAQDRHRFLA